MSRQILIHFDAKRKEVSRVPFESYQAVSWDAVHDAVGAQLHTQTSEGYWYPSEERYL